MWRNEINSIDCTRLIDRQFDSFVVLFEFAVSGFSLYMAVSFLYHRFIAVDKIAVELRKLHALHTRLAAGVVEAPHSLVTRRHVVE